MVKIEPINDEEKSGFKQGSSPSFAVKNKVGQSDSSAGGITPSSISPQPMLKVSQSKEFIEKYMVKVKENCIANENEMMGLFQKINMAMGFELKTMENEQLKKFLDRLKFV